MTYPDLVRPTTWKLHLRLWWGATIAHEVEAKFPEDAIESGVALGLKPDRIVKAEFLDLQAGLWHELPGCYLQEAIVLHQGATP